MRERHYLYRHRDARGQLLYVGVALDPLRRQQWHKNHSAWFDRIARIDIEQFPSREAVLDAEALAIARENPIFNQVRPDTRKRIKAMQHALDL